MTHDQDTLRAFDDRLAEIEKRLRDLARDLDLALDRDRAVHPARDIDRARGRALDLALYLDHVLGLDDNHDFALAFDLARARARVVTLAVALDRARAFTLDLARDRDLDLSHARTRAFDLKKARETSHAITTAFSGFRHQVQAELAAPNSDSAAPNADVTVSPARPTRRVLHGALRVLPAGDRARYREELDAELDVLAAAGASRRAQLAYALALAGRMWTLRRALRAPAPGRTRERVR